MLLAGCCAGSPVEGTSAAAWERVVFAAGGQAIAPVVHRDESVYLRGRDRWYGFPEDWIARREPCVGEVRPWPAEGPVAADPEDEQVRQAIRLLECGRPRECVARLLAASGDGPPPPHCREMLAAASAGMSACPDPERLGELSVQARGRFGIARSDHLALVHQGDSACASKTLQMLEEVVLAFYLDQARAGMRLDWPRERLVILWFGDRRGYQAFLEANGAAAYGNTQGFFLNRQRLVALYGPLAGGDDLGSGPLAETGSAPTRPLLDLARRRVIDECRERDNALAIAIHELVHALVRDSGLAPRLETFPTWLHEGLAAQYEVVAGSRWQGIGACNSDRLATWRQAGEPDHFGQMLGSTRFPPGYHARMYAMAWGFTHYLRCCEPERYAALLHALREPPADPLEADRSIRATMTRLFARDIDSLEQAAATHLRSLGKKDEGT